MSLLHFKSLGFMRLSDNDKKIIAAISVLGDSELPAIQRFTKLRAHTVRYHLDMLLERKILVPFMLVNVAPMGYSAYTLYFSITSDRPGNRHQVLQTFIESPCVSWVAEFVGDYNHAVTAYVRKPEEFTQLVDQATRPCAAFLSEKAISIEKTLASFPVKLFNDDQSVSQSLNWGVSDKYTDIDDLDHKVISALARNVRLSRTKLAKHLNVPLTTFQARVKRLIEKKIISGFTYLFDGSQLGYLVIKLLIYARGAHKEFGETLYKFCHRHRHVILYVSCVGSWDYEINVLQESSASSSLIVQELFSNFGNYIANIKTMQLHKHLKVLDYPFL